MTTTATTEHRLIRQDYRKLVEMYRAQNHPSPEDTALRMAADNYSSKNRHIPFGKVVEIIRRIVKLNIITG